MLCAISLQMAFAGQYDASQIDQMLDAVKKNKYYRQLDTDPGAMGLLLKSQEFEALQTRCREDWKEVIESLEVIEEDDRRKVLFWAMGQLTATDYMTLLETLTTKFEAGGVSEDVFKNALFAHGRMTAFAVDNYDHPRMAAVLDRVRITTSDNALKQRIARIRSGESKKVLDEYREAHQGLPEGDIPVVLLAK